MNDMNKVKNGWFSEICPSWSGLALSFEIMETLYSRASEFQQIDLYQTRHHGRMLVLDGIIQLTEFDEYTYQEMLAHLPLFSHPDPRHVLVIGGGDGGILREIGRHELVETIDFCEIDAAVIRVAKEFLPSLACGFDDPRVAVHIGDGHAFVKNKTHAYDVIIVDASDPIGPGETLYNRTFYQGLKNALKPGGIIACQGESIFMHQAWVTTLAAITRELFVIQAYANIQVPTYPGGNIGICMGSLGPELVTPAREISKDLQNQLKYYTPQMHKAAFVLPYFAENLFKER